MLKKTLLILLTLFFIFAVERNNIREVKQAKTSPFYFETETFPVCIAEYNSQQGEFKNFIDLDKFTISAPLTATLNISFALISSVMVIMFFILFKKNHFKKNHLRAPPTV